jgi:hypothetical protein
VVRLIYSAIASLDGYVEDGQGRFDWAEPDDEVFASVNDLERPIGTYLYGRRMFETMLSWETASLDADQPPFVRDFTQIWRAAAKVVYPRTPESVSSTRTKLVWNFDPVAVRRRKGRWQVLAARAICGSIWSLRMLGASRERHGLLRVSLQSVTDISGEVGQTLTMGRLSAAAIEPTNAPPSLRTPLSTRSSCWAGRSCGTGR